MGGTGKCSAAAKIVNCLFIETREKKTNARVNASTGDSYDAWKLSVLDMDADHDRFGLVRQYSKGKVMSIVFSTEMW